MLDLNPLLTPLAALGPWGILLGAAITLGIQWIRKRQGDAQPTPAPAPSPDKPEAPSKTPVLDALSNLLKLLAMRKTQQSATPAVQFGATATDADVDTDTAKRLLKVMLEGDLKIVE